MIHILVQMKTRDFSAWKKTFDSDQGVALRRNNGVITRHIFQDAEDPNQVTLLFEQESLEKARSYAKNPQLLEAMKKGGVIGSPNVSFLHEL